MSVRGSKNKIILYVAGICSVIFVVLLYHNASQRLEEMEKSYERCHLNEESLSAQLQVNLEYKVRLEKSLQQEKSEHAQAKEEWQNKIEEEKQGREKDNSESINKFSALQQQFKFLQSQHEDLSIECGKLRQFQLSEKEDKSRLEKQLQSLKNELKLVRENKDTDIGLLKTKNAALDKANSDLRSENAKLLNKLNLYEKLKTVGSQAKLPEDLPLNSSVRREEGSENILQQPELGGAAVLPAVKSSTSANKPEQELFPSGNNIYVNTSTPMINPDAVMSQDKMLSAAPVPQPRQESVQIFPAYGDKENVGAKPERLAQPKANEEDGARGVLHAPNIVNYFAHVPAIQQYKERLRQGAERNDNGGEVGDEGEPLMKNKADAEKQSWGEGLQFVRHPAGNQLVKNQVYHYQEYDHRKEEGEDDDDVDQLDYHNPMEKNQPHDDSPIVGNVHINIPLQEKRESVMIQPK